MVTVQDQQDEAGACRDMCACWQCGYDVSNLDARSVCPECAMPIARSREIEQVISRKRRRGVAACLFGCQLSLALFIAGPILLLPEYVGTDATAVVGVVICPVALLACGALAFAVCGWTLPPATHGGRGLWFATMFGAALTAALSSGCLLTMLARLFDADPFWLLAAAPVWALGLVTFAGACRCMARVMRRMRCTHQAAWWRMASIFLCTGAVSMLLSIYWVPLGPYVQTEKASSAALWIALAAAGVGICMTGVCTVVFLRYTPPRPEW